MKRKLFLNICFFATLSCACLLANEQLSLEIGETAVYKYPQARAVIVQDNQAVYVQNLEYNVVKVIGKKMGTAYLSVLDYDNNLQTVKIVVQNKKQNPFVKIIKRENKYSGSNVLYAKSDPHNKMFVNRKMLVNKLSLSTKVNDLGIAAKINYKSYATSATESDKSLDSLVLQFDFAKNRTIFGDNQIGYSEIVVPYLNLQGVRTVGWLRLQNMPVAYDLFIGKSLGSFWGRLLEYKSGFEDSVLTGANFTAVLTDNFSFGYLLAQKKNESNTVAKNSAIKAKYSLSDKVLLLSEIAYDLDSNHATVSDLKYANKNFDFNLKFTNIEANYTTVSDWNPVQQGKKGMALYSAWRQELFKIRVYVDKFSRLYPQTVLNENNVFGNRKMFVNFLRVPFTKPMLYFYESDFTNIKRGGWTLYLNEIDLKYLTFYFKYNPEYSCLYREGVKNMNTTATYGFNKNLDFVNLTLEKSLHCYNSHNIYRSYAFNTNTPWLSVPWFNSRLSYRYQTRTDQQRTVDDNISIYRAELRNSFTPDFSWNLSLKYTYSHSLRYLWQQEAYLFPNQDITQGSVEGSLSLIF